MLYSNASEVNNRELLDLLKLYFEDAEVPVEWIESIFASLNSPVISTVTGIDFYLKVEGLEGKVGYELSGSAKNSKVFEIVGTNQRFKTSTLIIIALILGFDFDGLDDELSSNQIVTRVNKMRKFIFENSDLVMVLKLSNADYSFNFEKYRDKLTFSDSDGARGEYYLENDFSIYEQYQEELSKLSIADVQFVSKGRNFVGHVHREIRDEFLATLNAIKKPVEIIVNNKLQESQTNSKIKQKTQVEIKNENVYLRNAAKALEGLGLSLNEAVLHSKFLNRKMDNFETISSVVKKTEKLNGEEKALNSLILVKQEEYNEKMGEIRKYINGLNAEAAPFGTNFTQNDILEKMQRIKNEWNGLLIGGESIKSILRDLEGEKVVPFTVSSNYLPSLFVKNKQDLMKLFENVSNHHMGVNKFLQVADGKIEMVDGLLKEKDLIQLKLRQLNDQRNTIMMELNELQSILDAFRYFGDYDDESYLDKVMEEVVQRKDYKLSLKIVKLLDEAEFVLNASSNSELLDQIHSRIKENEELLEKGKTVVSLPSQAKYTIALGKALQDLLAVIAYLDADPSSQSFDAKYRASVSTNLHHTVVGLFNDYMKERCKYYFEVISKEVVVTEVLSQYNFINQEFDINGRKVSTREGISGGTDSAMTVRSFASKPTLKKLGLILLVDEWGDVGVELAKSVYKTFEELDTFGFGIFVKVDDDYDVLELFAVAEGEKE
ncbi:hypothetical protein CBW65_18100 [Tumebacillus avium]|uniref:Uncharacterized protein n=1 Tax=Tumebacillus avium TaxID=1903704 RepID=A0A1Y0ITI7_9BACL|nr:hypothetical protein [Tumebacillus avium]ARU62674.1 hypothetical protein CBW65_18100 [Tumebacillus avium]